MDATIKLNETKTNAEQYFNRILFKHLVSSILIDNLHFQLN